MAGTLRRGERSTASDNEGTRVWPHRPRPKPTEVAETECVDRTEGATRVRPKPLPSAETGYEGFAPQHERASRLRAQSMTGLWRRNQSRPRMMGNGTETTPRVMFSEWFWTESEVSTSWVTSPEAIGRSSTAVMGMGTSLRRRGRECRFAKSKEIQEAVAPQSTSAYV